MALTAAAKLSSVVPVRIRISSLDHGTTKWKEGGFEIHEKDNKVNMLVKFNCGGPAKNFQLNHNVKNVVWGSMHHHNRMVLTLKDSSTVSIEKMPILLAKKMKEYIEALKQGKQPVMKANHGSANFGGVLGNRAVKSETTPERQSNSRRASLENREENTPRKPLGSPSRVTSTPVRSGLSEHRNEKRKRLISSDSDMSEDYPKENDSSSNNKATSDSSRKFLLSCKEKLKQSEENRTSAPLAPAPLQPTSFYGSRTVTKDYTQSHSFLDRPSSTTQSPSLKRTLLPNHSTPFKKARPSTDYGGWNRPRPATLSQPQPSLQGFSNLGNTCYMNAILQSLFSLPSFSNDLLKQGIPWKKVPGNALLRRFAHLLAKKDISCPEVKKDLLRRVKSSISSTAERFSGYMQNDAHEFLSQCLDQLKEDVEKVNKSWKNEPSTWDEPPSLRLGEETETSRTYTCPVVVNMEFEVQHTISCTCCGEVVTKCEQFNDLSIDLPRRKKTLPLRSIQDSLDLFFRMEEIEYSCEKCNGKAATVTHKFSRLPRVLILHLKRYTYNTQLSLNSKLGQQVVIPKYLTLLSHCTEFTQPPLYLGWSARTAMFRTAKNSQAVNQSLRKGTLKPCSSSCVMDSDSEEELTRKVKVTGKQRLSECLADDERPEEVQQNVLVEQSDFNTVSDDDMLAAVLEMSRNDPELNGTSEDKSTSSPDTGFGDTDGQDLTSHMDLMDGDRQFTEALDCLDLTTMDENKENQTPEGVQGELDWVQQYSLDQEREEQELQQALAQSLQEHEAREMREDDDLKRATELSLQEFNNSFPELLCSDDDSGNEDVLDMEYTEAEAEELKRNAENGHLGNSYRLISVVSHIGSSSSSGHYISDVYDMKKQSWLTYNDLDVSRTQESTVQRDRDRSGYIFFYMHKDVFDELAELEKTGGSSEAGRTVLQPL
ncbi:ubiquitin carboxyl-terminal hydrolase 37 [Denticeps clupeoides]|uniref:ubiquitin carboxyl-terminal hydrolase 37 n=1 Tax=Denticeps clupeoides TaxID=299321 RepID=UPI0010A3E8D1|nr:ubiquitin carboxyl-terminal hydrolase 37 [Denticeps clupeoides]XP_028847901.1 ubiquitin carboxyl-terminal hydrolase 37 [Denticeps clupeoides]